MKIILSPAKSLDFETAKQVKNPGVPHFIKESQQLITSLKKLNPKKIKELMHVSEAIANLNYERFQNWSYPFTPEASGAAMYVFNGEAYRGLDAANLSEKESLVAQEKLRILSGLYGVLKPFDAILPYRLEMGTGHTFSSKHKTLYSFWGDQLSNYLESEMEPDEVLVNVASNEYSKALKLSKFNRPVIECAFKEDKNGEYKTIMTFAKKARGMMARYIIKNDINKAEDLKGFDSDNYFFNNKLSTETEFVFTR